MSTALVVHGHFYQPPRENPWTGAVEPERNAAPFHDWNERVHAECYRPNAFARVFDRRGRVADIVNNYARMSFDVGPTLMSWLERHHPSTYGRIVEADDGHRAMAQGYNHAILPLCNQRDRRTQILWGLADFAHRFGRPAQGMWLPETAADDATLAALIDAGVRFTVLAPSQAQASHVDTGQAYSWSHPDGSGRSLSLFFYDGPLARAVAFEKGTATSELFVERLERASQGGLVHLATDGETYGHHVPFADRTLAFALTRHAPERGFEVTSYQRYLDQNPPTSEMGIVSPSSWSCEHGVGRWERDCGCSTGGHEGDNQRWRGPLRRALDLLREEAASVFEAQAGDLLGDPWEAREAYVDVLLGRLAATELCDARAGRALSDKESIRARTLLEMQRHAMLMYTSCGWFFHDLCGIETTQVLKYASRAMDLMEEVGAAPPRERFLAALAEATSNDPDEGTGDRVFATHVEPVRTPGWRVAAHLALLFLVRATPSDGVVCSWRVRSWAARRESHGRVTLATGRIDLESLVTGQHLAYAWCTLYMGGMDFYGCLVPFTSWDDLETAAAPLWEAFPGASLPRLLQLVRESFPGEEFGLEQALPDGAQQIVESVFADLVERFGLQHERLFDDHHRILELLQGTIYQMPRELLATVELALSRRLDAEIAAQGGSFDRRALGRALDIAKHARTLGWKLDTSRSAEPLSAAVTQAVDEAVAEPTPDAVEAAVALLDLADDLGIDLDLDQPQQAVFPLRHHPGALTVLASRLNLAT